MSTDYILDTCFLQQTTGEHPFSKISFVQVFIQDDFIDLLQIRKPEPVWQESVDDITVPSLRLKTLRCIFNDLLVIKRKPGQLTCRMPGNIANLFGFWSNKVFPGYERKIGNGD